MGSGSGCAQWALMVLEGPRTRRACNENTSESFQLAPHSCFAVRVALFPSDRSRLVRASRSASALGKEMLRAKRAAGYGIGAWAIVFLAICVSASVVTASRITPGEAAKKKIMSEKVRKMFYHAYDNYIAHAFPRVVDCTVLQYDELKPLTKSYTNSLSELGNLKLEHLPQNYKGSALTLIESLSSLVVLGNYTEFERAVLWLADNLTFDVDARINLFECNIRVLGGLVSAHILATDSSNRLVQGIYKNQLLNLADDLGQRFLAAFNTPTGLPYAWINLKHGVMENETTETSTSGCGSLILEMGALSRLTGDSKYEEAALRALRKLWSMRSPLNLLGTTLDVVTGNWLEYSSGIGAGVDSFYEYLMKAYILFGREELWDMFHTAYLAVQKHFRHGPWCNPEHLSSNLDEDELNYSVTLSFRYHEADMRTGKATYWQLTSLQAFWPGLQASNFESFLPGYLLDHEMLHPTEKYYPLRPELAESTLYLYQATKDPWYLEVGESIVNSLNIYTKVEGGFASIKDVSTMQLEDHMHSFFLAEMCKYLYLLYDDSFLAGQNYIFTTEGHPLPVKSSWHDRFYQIYLPANWSDIERGSRAIHASAMSSQICPEMLAPMNGGAQVESACHVPDARIDHRCRTDEECGLNPYPGRVNGDSSHCSWLHYPKDTGRLAVPRSIIVCYLFWNGCNIHRNGSGVPF
ncbi:Alpha-mannosidase I mns5 [Asimina triloba]